MSLGCWAAEGAAGWREGVVSALRREAERGVLRDISDDWSKEI